MANTTPNKEIIRRLSLHQGATYCYININTGNEFVEILTNIKSENFIEYKKELKDWTGMKFLIYNTHSKQEKIKELRNKGEKILPISL